MVPDSPDQKAPEIIHRILKGEGLGTPYAGTYAVPPRAPEFAVPSRPLHPRLVERLAAHGIEELFTHQAAAYDLATA